MYVMAECSDFLGCCIAKYCKAMSWFSGGKKMPISTDDVWYGYKCEWGAKAFGLVYLPF